MTPLAVLPLLALPAGLVTFAFIRRWPRLDPLAVSVSRETLVDEVRRHPRLRALVRSRLNPAEETGLLLTAALGVLVAGVGLVAEMVHAHRGLASYDLSFTNWGANNASASSTRGLKYVSFLGGYPPLLAFSCLVAFSEYRRHLSRSVVALLVLVVGGQFLVTDLIKLVVDRARPAVSQLTGFSGASFPSGHAAAAAASYGVYALILGRRRSPMVKALLGGAATAIAVAVAATRVLLGVHWFTDVLAGLLVGSAWFTLLSVAFGGRVMRFGVPVEKLVPGVVLEPGAAAPSPSRSGGH